jgi:hypothetical protein
MNAYVFVFVIYTIFSIKANRKSNNRTTKHSDTYRVDEQERMKIDGKTSNCNSWSSKRRKINHF